jgi:vacuolar-type H+-ATPase subunit E/Vma4
MENLSPLVKKIMEKAETEAAAIMAEADSVAGRVKEASRTEASQRSAAILQNARSKGQESIRRANVQASLAIRNDILAEKGKWVWDVLNELPIKLHSLNDKDYATMLRGFVLSVAPLGLVHVLPAPKDKGIFDSAFVKGMNEVLQARGQETTLILTGEVADIEGGLLLSGENVSVDCSLRSICEYHADELEPIISAALFTVEANR